MVQPKARRNPQMAPAVDGRRATVLKYCLTDCRAENDILSCAARSEVSTIREQLNGRSKNFARAAQRLKRSCNQLGARYMTSFLDLLRALLSPIVVLAAAMSLALWWRSRFWAPIYIHLIAASSTLIASLLAWDGVDC
jgi:hypothetical protein